MAKYSCIGDNVKYTTKDGISYCVGKVPNQMARSDLDQLAHDLSTGEVTKDSSILEHGGTYFSYKNGINEIINDYANKATKKFRKISTIGLQINKSINKLAPLMTKNTYIIRWNQLHSFDDYKGETRLFVELNN